MTTKQINTVINSVINSNHRNNKSKQKTINLAACFFITIHYLSMEKKETLQMLVDHTSKENKESRINLFVAYELSRQIPGQIPKGVDKGMDEDLDEDLDKDLAILSDISNSSTDLKTEKLKAIIEHAYEKTNEKGLQKLPTNTFDIIIRTYGTKLSNWNNVFWTAILEKVGVNIECFVEDIFKIIFEIIKNVAKLSFKLSQSIWSKKMQDELIKDNEIPENNSYKTYFTIQVLDYFDEKEDDEIQQVRNSLKSEMEIALDKKFQNCSAEDIKSIKTISDQYFRECLELLAIMAKYEALEYYLEIPYQFRFDWSGKTGNKERTTIMKNPGHIDDKYINVKELRVWPDLIYTKENKKITIEGWWLNVVFSLTFTKVRDEYIEKNILDEDKEESKKLISKLQQMSLPIIQPNEEEMKKIMDEAIEEYLEKARMVNNIFGEKIKEKGENYNILRIVNSWILVFEYAEKLVNFLNKHIQEQIQTITNKTDKNAVKNIDYIRLYYLTLKKIDIFFNEEKIQSLKFLKAVRTESRIRVPSLISKTKEFEETVKAMLWVKFLGESFNPLITVLNTHISAFQRIDNTIIDLPSKSTIIGEVSVNKPPKIWAVWPQIMYTYNRRSVLTGGWYLIDYSENISSKEGSTSHTSSEIPTDDIVFVDNIPFQLQLYYNLPLSILIDESLCGLVKRNVNLSQLYNNNIGCGIINDRLEKTNYVLFLSSENPNTTINLENVKALYFVVRIRSNEDVQNLSEDILALPQKYRDRGVQTVGLLFLKDYDETWNPQTPENFKKEIVETSIGIVFGFQGDDRPPINVGLADKLNENNVDWIQWIPLNMDNNAEKDLIPKKNPIITCILNASFLTNIQEEKLLERIGYLNEQIRINSDKYKLQTRNWQTDFIFILLDRGKQNELLNQLKMKMNEIGLTKVQIVNNYEEAKDFIAANVKNQIKNYEIYLGNSLMGIDIDKNNAKSIDQIENANVNSNKKIYVFTTFQKYVEELGNVETKYCEKQKNCSDVKVYVAFHTTIINETKMKEDLNIIRTAKSSLNIYPFVYE